MGMEMEREINCKIMNKKKMRKRARVVSCLGSQNKEEGLLDDLVVEEAPSRVESFKDVHQYQVRFRDLAFNI